MQKVYNFQVEKDDIFKWQLIKPISYIKFYKFQKMKPTKIIIHNRRPKVNRYKVNNQKRNKAKVSHHQASHNKIHRNK